MTATEQPVSAPQAVIHDLGYRPYTGPRRPPSRRFLVIARHVVTLAWRSRWGVKAPVLLAGLATVIVAGFMWAMGHKLAQDIRSHGVPLPTADALVYQSITSYAFLGFLLATTVGCAAAADDLRTGAFTFYFSRPIRPRDYVAGKLLGVSIVVGFAVLAPMIVLALFRLVTVQDGTSIWRALGLLPRATALGVVATIALATTSAGVGALVRRRRIAQAAFVVFYLPVGLTAAGVAQGLSIPWLALFSVLQDVDLVGRALFGIDIPATAPPAWAAAAALVAMTAAGSAILVRRVARAETTGIGGGA